MALALDGSSPAFFSNRFALAGSITSASFTAPAGAVIICAVMANSWAQTVTTTVTDSGGLSWTKAAQFGNGSPNGMVEIWWARTTSSASRTVNVARTTHGSGNTTDLAARVTVWTGAVASGSPIGATAANSSTTNNLTAGYTSTRAASRAVGCALDWNALGTPATSDTSDGTYHVNGEMSAIAVHKATDSGASGSSVTLNFDASGSSAAAWRYVIVELLPPASGEEHDTAGSIGVDVSIAATAVKRAAMSAPLSLGLTAGSSDSKDASTAAALDVEVALDAAAVMHAVTAATLGVVLDIAAASTRLVVTAAELGVDLTFEAAAQKIAAAAASLGLAIGTTGVAVKTAATDAVLDLAVSLHTDGVKAVQVASVLGIDLAVTASSEAVEPGHVSADIAFAVACVTAAVKRAVAAAAFGVDVGVTGHAVKAAAVASDLDVALAVAATATPVGPVSAAATFGVALTIAGSTVKHSGSVSTLAVVVALAAIVPTGVVTIIRFGPVAVSNPLGAVAVSSPLGDVTARVARLGPVEVTP